MLQITGVKYNDMEENEFAYLGAGREVRRSPLPSDRPRPGGGCRSAYLSEMHLQPCGQLMSQTQTYSVERTGD